MATVLLTSQAVAIELLRQMVNRTFHGEFSDGQVSVSTLIVGRSYTLDSISEEFIYDFCAKAADELMQDIRATGRKVVVELPHIEREDLRSELVTDRESHLSARMTIVPDYIGGAAALIRCEVGLNP